jgi:hypothetical protein
MDPPLPGNGTELQDSVLKADIRKPLPSSARAARKGFANEQFRQRVWSADLGR